MAIVFRYTMLEKSKHRPWFYEKMNNQGHIYVPRTRQKPDGRKGFVQCWMTHGQVIDSNGWYDTSRYIKLGFKKPKRNRTIQVVPKELRDEIIDELTRIRGLNDL